MKKFLIEVPHPPDKLACKRAIQIFLETGSHFLSKADWGCLDGEHKAWIIVEVNNKEEAKYVVPPLFRSDAKIIELTTFTNESLQPEEMHEA